MGKRSYCIATFPKSSWKSPLADLSELVLGTIDRVCEILEMYSDESCVQYPEMILHNIMLNNETVFDHEILDAPASEIVSCRGQPSRELTSPKKGDSGNVFITGRKLMHTLFDKYDVRVLIFDNESKKPVKSDNLEKETTAIGAQEIVDKAQMISSSAGDEKMDIATTHDVGEETDAKAGWKVLQESHEKIKSLMRRNFVQINSMTVFKQVGEIGVEIDIDLPSVSPASSPEKQDSSSSGIIKSPGNQENRKSPSTPPFKRVPSESLPAVDNSDSNILNFYAKLFLSKMNSRKVGMEHIQIFFQKFLRDVQVFHNTINNLDFVVESLPMANEPYLTDYLVKLRSDLINKAQEMLCQTKPLVIQVEEEVKVWNDCLEEFNTFEKEHGPSLSTKGVFTLTISDLKGLESRLKEICKDAYGTVILNNGRREILLNLTTDFKWLVKHFVEFLIITEILISPSCGTSQVSKDD